VAGGVFVEVAVLFNCADMKRAAAIRTNAAITGQDWRAKRTRGEAGGIILVLYSSAF